MSIRREVQFLLIFIAALTCGCAVLVRENHVRLTCGSCHEEKPAEGRPVLKNSENPSETCKKCHKYRDDGEHHPSDPEGELLGRRCAEVDPLFPLISGKIECLTCHQMHSEKRFFTGTKYFLRGGPYNDRREICFRCHKKEMYEEMNPHNEMITDKKELNFSTCLVCHSAPPDPKKDRSKDVKFRASVAFLCWRCHPPMLAEFLDRHFLRTPSKTTFEEMIRGEVKNRIIMPLDFKGRITCSTCHNPHQPGVMAFEAAQKGAGTPKKLRDPNSCEVCHGSRK